MSNKIGTEQLRHKIVTHIRNEGLDGVFEENTINAIVEKVYHTYQQQHEMSSFSENQHEEELHEDSQTRPPVQGGPNHFPYEDDFIETGHPHENEASMEDVGDEAGSEPTEMPYEPVRADYPPAPVPEPLREQTPGEIIVFDYNEAAAVSGENLAQKPFRLKDDPESKQSIHDFWMKEGKTQVKVYAAKFEEIGTIEFNYQNGTAHFSDIKQPTSPNKEYQENPYAASAMPQIDTPATETDLRKTLESSVDLENVLMKVLKGIIKDGLKEQPETTEPTIPTPAPVQERMTVDKIKSSLKNVATPGKIKQRLLGEMVSGVEYIGQSNEFSTYLLEGKKYHIINGEEEKAYVSP